MNEPVKGLGDVVKKVTEAVGITPCASCEKRRQWLNQKVPLQKPKEPEKK